MENPNKKELSTRNYQKESPKTGIMTAKAT